MTAPGTIPSADDPAAISVCDGLTKVGTVVERGGSYFAFDISGELIGEFSSRIQAMRSLPQIEEGA